MKFYFDLSAHTQLFLLFSIFLTYLTFLPYFQLPSSFLTLFSICVFLSPPLFVLNLSLSLLVIGSLHLYNAIPSTLLPNSQKKQKDERAIDSKRIDSANRENEGADRRELLEVPLLHPKDSFVTAVSYHGSDGKK